MKSFLLRCAGGVMLFLASMTYFLSNQYRDGWCCIKTVIDDVIPFNALFVVPYLYWYVYVFVIGFLYFFFVDHEKYWRFIACITVGTGMSCLLFYLFPTVVMRPAVCGVDVYSNLVRLVYEIDRPYNCCPSLHVLHATLVSLFFIWHKPQSLPMKIFAITSFVLIMLSTLFIKQHYVWDVVVATCLALVLFFLFSKDAVWQAVKRIAQIR